LAIVLVLELGAGVSIFAYRAKLKEGFDKGLTDAMENYHNDNHTKISTDLDLIQKTVKLVIFPKILNLRTNYSCIAAVTTVLKIGSIYPIECRYQYHAAFRMIVTLKKMLIRFILK